MGSIGDRLSRARAHRFVGRRGEIELFAAALAAEDEPPFSVLFVHGPGGVGKTTLLGAFARAADDHLVAWVRVDARTMEPTPGGFLGALATALDTGVDEVALTLDRERHVVLVDTYERATPIDDWLREELLPSLAGHTLVVLAGRSAPAPAWRADPGWRDALRVVSLRNLAPGEARHLLAGEGIASATADRVAALTHGHPLALALCVELLHRGHPLAGGLESVPDLVTTLLERFLDDVTDTEQRLALGLAARVRVTDESLLRAVIGARAPELFDWLRGLSFMEHHELGLFPHDLAREVLDSDLRWRDRAAFERLHRRARTFILERAAEPGRGGQRMVTDLMFLHRTNPVMAGVLDFDQLGRSWPEPVVSGSGEAAEVIDLVRRHQGDEQAALAERWFARQPEAFLAFRDADRRLVGAAGILHLHDADPADIAADPGTEAMWAHACRHDPPRAGEAVMASRFFVGSGTDQAVNSAAFTTMAVAHTQHVLRLGRAAWDYIGAMSNVDDVAPVFGYIFYDHVKEASYEVGGRRYHVFAHDWRRMGLEAWLDATGEQELSDELPLPRSIPAAPTVVLSQADFATSVRAALRDLHDPRRLGANPLMRSRVVRDVAGEAPTPGDLRALVVAAIEALAADPRAEKAARSLDRTYVRPAESQERAAEVLGLPFSTYRRHLTRGAEWVTGWLWQRELYGAGGPN